MFNIFFITKTALIPDLKAGVFDRAVFGTGKLKGNFPSQKSEDFCGLKIRAKTRVLNPEFSIKKLWLDNPKTRCQIGVGGTK